MAHHEKPRPLPRRKFLVFSCTARLHSRGSTPWMTGPEASPAPHPTTGTYILRFPVLCMILNCLWRRVHIWRDQCKSRTASTSNKVLLLTCLSCCRRSGRCLSKRSSLSRAWVRHNEVLTVAPRYGDDLAANKEQQRKPTCSLLIKHCEPVNTRLREDSVKSACRTFAWVLHEQQKWVPRNMILCKHPQ